MPIYEYVCQSCGNKFEKLVLGTSSTTAIECPKCKSDKVEKAFSVFGMASSTVPATSCATGST